MTLTIKTPHVLLFKYLWILVLCPKELQFFLLLIFIILINTDRLFKFRFYPDTLFLLMLSFSAIHIISIILNVILYETKPDRIAAAFNTALIWVIAAFAYSYFKNHKVKLERIYKLSYVNLLILTILSCLSLISFYLLKNSGGDILGISLYGTDWFRGRTHLRFKGGMEYSNLVVILYILLMPFAVSYLKHKGTLFRYLFVLVSFLPVILSLSRSGYLITGLAYFLAFLLAKDHKRKDYLFAATLILASIIFLLLFKEHIGDSIYSLIHARRGSNHTRMHIYLESIKLTLANSPIWGMGIKHISEYGYPLGSHSTYIGVFYKTGIAGTLVFISMLLAIAKILLTAKHDRVVKAEAIFITMLFVEFAFEDIDGANWVTVLLFSIIGMMDYKEEQENVSNLIRPELEQEYL